MSQKRAFTLVLKQPGRLKVTASVKIEVDANYSPAEMNMLKRKLAANFMQALADTQQLHCYISDVEARL